MNIYSKNDLHIPDGENIEPLDFDNSLMGETVKRISENVDSLKPVIIKANGDTKFIKFTTVMSLIISIAALIVAILK